MKRRSFLQFFGLAPAAAALPAAAQAVEKFAETAARLEPNVEAAVPVYETVRGDPGRYSHCTISCCTSLSMAWQPPKRR